MIREEIRTKIRNYEVSPPPAVWEKVLDTLEKEQQPAQITVISGTTPKTPVRRLPAVLKYAAVLLLLAGLSTIWYQFKNQGLTNAIIAAAPNLPSNTGGTVIIPSEREKSPQIGNTDYNQSNVANKQVTGKLLSETDEKLEHSRIDLASTQQTVYHPEQSAHSLTKKLAAESIDDDNNLINENYFYLTDTDGQQVRVSKKLSAVMLGEWGLIDPHSFVGQNEIQQLANKISHWKSRLASSTFIPSATNLMDLLTLIDLQNE